MATITYTVTVATGTNAFSATNPKFFIDSIVSPVLYLQEGNTYIFDQSDTSNNTYALVLSSTKDGVHATTAYLQGVTTVGTAGTAVSIYTNYRRSGKNCRRSSKYFIMLWDKRVWANTAQTIAPTSETTEFNPQIDEIIEEAYERTGIRGTRTGYQLRSARRSSNL